MLTGGPEQEFIDLALLVIHAMEESLEKGSERVSAVVIFVIRAFYFAEVIQTIRIGRRNDRRAWNCHETDYWDDKRVGIPWMT